MLLWDARAYQGTYQATREATGTSAGQGSSQRAGNNQAQAGQGYRRANGSNGANLPVPATYIIGKDGKIKYAFFNTDYRKRASVREIINNL